MMSFTFLVLVDFRFQSFNEHVVIRYENVTNASSQVLHKTHPA